MTAPILPDQVLDPSVGGGITSAWGDQLNLCLAYLMRDRPHCRVYNSALQVIGTGAHTAITFDSERVDVGAMHSTSSNQSRLTVTDPGFYLFIGHVDWAASAAGIRNTEVRVNGTTFVGIHSDNNESANVLEQTVTAVYQMAAGDYAELCVFQTSGGNLNVNASPNYSPEFSAMWLCS